MTHSQPRPTRRSFLSHSVSAGLALPLAARVRLPAPARRKKTILVLGGTGFLGPAIVEAALARGHELTLFNRGHTNPQLFPDLEKLRGDRDGKLQALEGRKWDAVVDTSGYVPRIAKMSAELLKDAVQRYVFVSTISVYAHLGETNDPVDEASPVGTLDDPTVETVDGRTYGPLKALCEQVVTETLPGRATIVRPGLIVGPRDSSDRFTYWPLRARRGGEVLAPGDPDQEVQFIDVRDLGEWIVHCIEADVDGTYDAVGFDGRLSMQELLHGCKCATTTDCRFTWVDERFLAEQGVQPWMEMPLWLPSSGVAHIANDRARKAGLTFRPVADTIAATLEWALHERGERAMRAGLAADKEAKVLAAWSARPRSR